MIAVDHSNANRALPTQLMTGARLAAHDPDDLADVLQCHQLIDLEPDAELALETARERSGARIEISLGPLCRGAAASSGMGMRIAAAGSRVPFVAPTNSVLQGPDQA